MDLDPGHLRHPGRPVAVEVLFLPRDRFALAAAAIPFALLAILSALALLQTVPGQPGLWVETATLMLAAYLAGCLAGGAGRLAAKRG
ncbi:hypothetical protein FV217_20925 [Methylobacterium sp. WL9]|nr:hypothetical protein FV217_20925 [Methylobacterium sp. WL9]